MLLKNMNKNILIREIKLSDVKTINTWRNNRQEVEFLCTNFRFINEEIDHDWYKTYLENRFENIRLAICSNNELVGLLYILNIDYINRNAELSIWVGNSIDRRKGYGEFGCKAALDHAFNNINLNKIYLKVLETNGAAVSLYKKLGFKIDGISRESLFKNGKYLNVIEMSILKSEF
jgi:RimJ/RimL family protein N-acetyltransferase